jgi:hypothetical protein
MLGAFAVGTAFGYVSQRGGFCLGSGTRAVLAGDRTKMKALGLAVAVQLLALPFIFAAGLARRPELPLLPLAAVAGGLLFGASMRWAGGCAAGVWYKLGAGDVGSLLAVLGMILGASVADTGPLHGVRSALQRFMPAVTWGPSPPVSIAAGLVLLGALLRSADGRAGAWSWRKTGLWVGLVAALAWPLSASAGRDFGLSIVPGSTGLLAGLVGRPYPAWDVALVLGVVAGGWLAMRQGGPVALKAPDPSALVRRFLGGLGLGAGASVATGCTVGQGLTGLALLAPSSFVVMGAIFAGSAGSALLTRRRA